MRTVKAILVVALNMTLGIAATGCATQQTATLPPATLPADTHLSYRPVSAAALAFDPPMTLAQPLPDTSREGRSPSAFYGYEEAVTTVSTVYQRDQIRNTRGGQLDRQAYTSRTSITTR